MPGVHFDRTLGPRKPEADELYVMDEFRQHAGRCSTCSHPYEVFQEDGKLCPRGQSLAKDVKTYVYKPLLEEGKKMSTSASLALPSEWSSRDKEAIRSLLKAIGHGMTFSSLKPVVVSEDFVKQYYYPQKTVSPEREEMYIERTPQRSSSTRAGRPRYTHDEEVTGRGSLYKKDEAEREKRQKRMSVGPIIIEASPGYRFRQQQFHR